MKAVSAKSALASTPAIAGVIENIQVPTVPMANEMHNPLLNLSETEQATLLKLHNSGQAGAMLAIASLLTSSLSKAGGKEFRSELAASVKHSSTSTGARATTVLKAVKETSADVKATVKALHALRNVADASGLEALARKLSSALLA